MILAYLGGATAWLYVVAATSERSAGSPGRAWVVLGALVVGLALGRWPAVLLPLLLPLLAVRAGRGTGDHPAEVDVAGEMMILVVPASLIAASVGVGVRKIIERRRCRHDAGECPPRPGAPGALV